LTFGFLKPQEASCESIRLFVVAGLMWLRVHPVFGLIGPDASASAPFFIGRLLAEGAQTQARNPGFPTTLVDF
jgi:hypothetical protein